MISNRHRAIALTLAGAALAAGFAVIPRPREIALMRMRDKQFDRARAGYEERYRQGDRSAPTLGSLTDIYLQYGEVAKAVEMMERYVEQRPGDREARKRLGTLYQFAQQPLLYIRNLERLVAADPREEELRELSRGYSFFHRPEDQVGVLRRLIAKGFGKAQDYQDLANLLGSLHRLSDAALVLEDWRRSGRKFTDPMSEMLVRIYLDHRRPDKALEVAKHAAKVENASEAAQLSALFRQQRLAEGAYEILQASGDRPDSPPDVIQEWTEVERRLGRLAPAFERLNRLASAGKMPCALIESWMTLALQTGRTGLAASAAARPACPVPASLAGDILERLLEDREFKIAEAIVQRHGRHLLERRPLLEVEWALASGNTGWAALALGRLPASEEKAAFYLKMQQLEPALATGRAIRSRQVLLDVYHLASDAGNAGLRLRAAAALVAEFPGADTRLLRVAAWMDQGQPVEALEDLRVLRRSAPANEEVGTLYRQAVLAAAEADRPVAAELAELAGTLLRAENVEAQERSYLVGLLRRHKLWKLALPELEREARRGTDEGLWNYVEAARAAQERDGLVRFLKSEADRRDLPAAAVDTRVDLLAEEDRAAALPYLAARADRPGLPAPELRQLAWRLNEAGDSRAAVRVFERLAANDGPAGKDTEQFLFLSENDQKRTWLLSRAQGATGPERAHWIGHLAALGAPAPLESGGHPEVRAALLRAHQASRDILRFQKVLREAIPEETSAAGLHRLVELAREENLEAVASIGLERLLSLHAGDPRANREWGKLLYGAGRYTEARTHLERAGAAGGADAETRLLLGDLARRDGDSRASHAHWGEAHREAQEKQPLIAAQALGRLGRAEEAARQLAALEAAPELRPAALAERISIYIESNDWAAARKALGQAPGGASPARFEQLEAQLAAAQGDTRTARRILEPLVARFPADAQSTAQLAAVAHQEGRLRAAETLYKNAISLEPRREDWTEPAEQVRRERAAVSGTELVHRTVGPGWRESTIRVEGQQRLTAGWKLRVTAESNEFALREARRTDGAVGDVAGRIRRGEAGVEWEGESGRKWKAALTGARSPGAVSEASWLGGRGATTLIGEWKKPFWEFSEGLAANGIRDRAAVERQQTIGRKGAAWTSAGWNRYGLDGAAGAARTVSASGGVSYALRVRSPALVLQYSADKEHVLDRLERLDASGARFAPLPVLSREVHAGTAGTSGEWRRRLRWDASGGWAADRLGGKGPYASGSANWRVGKHWTASVSFDRRLNRIATVGGTATAWKASLWWIP